MRWLIQRQIKLQDFSLTLPTCLGLVTSTEDVLLHHALLMMMIDTDAKEEEAN